MGAGRLPTVLGFAGALAVLGTLVVIVGLDDVVAALSRARLGILVLVVLVALSWMTAWGLALKTVLGAMGAPISSVMAVLVYTGAIFSNNVTPFGQAGGEPLSAMFISSAADSEYETGLAAIASVDALHFVPSIGLGLVGLAFAVVGAVTVEGDVAVAAAVVTVMAIVVVVAGYLGWRFRYELESLVVRVSMPAIRAAGRVLPGRSPPKPDAIEDRIDGFFQAVERVATDRTTLVRALGLSAVGWFGLMVCLWLSLYSLGVVVPFGTVMVAVPVAGFAAVTPLPGGSGAIETVLVTMLVPTPGVSGAVAMSAVLIYRGATYLLPIVIGGGVATALGADRAGVHE